MRKLCLGIILLQVFIFNCAAQNAAYNNFDFVSGEKVLFDDNLYDAQDGEFPPRWKLLNGQGVVNKVEGTPAFVFTDASLGSMGKIAPRIKTANYLGKDFTIEEDFFIPEDEMLALYFVDAEGDDSKFISIEGSGTIKNNYFPSELVAQYPNNEFLHGKWHHLAIAYKNRQMKIYVDQHRVLVLPDIGFDPVSLQFGGSLNVKIKNMKVAEGGNMNMLGKILTDGKFVSHAIKFDVGKSKVKDESMGFINELVKWLNENASIQLEIGGHTDSDGDDAANLKLSQERAEAVKNILVSKGVASARLTSKGYGETKPLESNTTPEGKANNRRVEFVKR